MTQRHIRLALLLAGTIASASVSADSGGQDCIDGKGRAAVSACRTLAERLSADKKRLQALAQSLEAAGSHAAATAVYETAGRFYPKDRLLLQGLIRARSNLRSMSLVNVPTDRLSVQTTASQPDTANKTSPCWTLEWTDALAACESERRTNPGDASLQERTGDVLRSIGRVDEALAAYDLALGLSPSSEHLKRKRRSLALLAGNELEHTANEAPVEGLTAHADEQTENESSIVTQLELLETLRGRELIDESEYRERRARIMGLAFSPQGQTATVPATTARQPIDAAKYGRYRALVIGNNRYGKFQELGTPIADAKAVSELLRSAYGFEVTTLLDATRYQMANALSRLRRESGAADNVLIYYAGHGYLDETTKRGYWLPIDAEPDSFANWISTSDVTDTLAGISARHALVVADSCFSGSLLRAAGGANLDEREAQIERLFQKRSRTVMTSGGLEPVLDGNRGTQRARHSIFAAAFLDALSENRNVLEVSRLFVGLRDKVTSYAEQTPQYAPIRNAGHEGGEFLFVPRSNP